MPDKHPLQVWVSHTLYLQLKLAARKARRSLAQYVRLLLEDAVNVSESHGNVSEGHGNDLCRAKCDDAINETESKE